ncbi:hypothetical protein Ancab_012888 [Ancistrocladus abbreviatus]
MECGRTSNAKAAAVAGEVLAMRLKVEGLQEGQGRGIHVDVKKEIEKKGFKNRTKVWAIVNAMKNNGVELILEENNDRLLPELLPIMNLTPGQLTYMHGIVRADVACGEHGILDLPQL